VAGAFSPDFKICPRLVGDGSVNSTRAGVVLADTLPEETATRGSDAHVFADKTTANTPETPIPIVMSLS